MKRRLGFVSAWMEEEEEACVPRVVVDGKVRDLESLVSSPRVRALESLRLMGIDASGVWEVGGGGRGERLSSPMRSRVRVSWALVGMPLRRVLEDEY